jgi:predicted ATP-grasp superfamily ATP-dependent carboligase
MVIGDMDLVRPLGMGGIRTIAAGPKRPETAWSRYTADTLVLPDLWHEPERVVEKLVRYGASRGDQPTIIYQRDPAVLLLSRYREVVSEHFRVLLPDPGVVEVLVDKHLFQIESQRLSLPVPRAVFLTDGGRDPAGWQSLRFPVIVKPALRNRTERAWRPVATGAKAVLCETPDRLVDLVRRPELQAMTLAVQEYIPGDETTLVSYHAFVAPNGDIVGDFTGRKIRTIPPEFGQSTTVVITDDAEVKAMGQRVLRAFDFHGVAKVDMKRDDEGRLHVFEVNPRFNLWHHPGAVAGVNLPAAVHYFLTTGQTDRLPPAVAGTRWTQVWGDARAARARGVPLVSWVGSVARSGARRAFHFDDPGAMLGALAWGVTKGLRGPARRERA